MANSANRFRYFDGSPEVIRLKVKLYAEYPLSLRSVEDLLAERGNDRRLGSTSPALPALRGDKLSLDCLHPTQSRTCLRPRAGQTETIYWRCLPAEGGVYIGQFGSSSRR